MVARGAGLERAGAADAGRLVDTLADAFAADPFFRWMFGPEEASFRTGMQAWLDLVVSLALPRGEGWLAGEDEGAVIWLPPGAEVASTDDLVRAGRILAELAGERAGEILGAIAGGGTAVPDAPHWLCLYIGVRPASRGSGLGRALLQVGLDAADAAGGPAHLVSTNPATAPFYERFGFRVLAEVAAGPGIPVLRPMWRDAKG